MGRPLRIAALIQAQRRAAWTITTNNGTEFHGHAAIEQAPTTRFYSATSRHAWDRGTSKNTNGLVRQYLPKRQHIAHLTQPDGDAIATRLNHRPHKQLGYCPPKECDG
ncbi:MAG: IS30 family transposase [Gemmatimonadales bacterium]|nr:IS30 family transposase [Gemmatimonadales bacterium]